MENKQAQMIHEICKVIYDKKDFANAVDTCWDVFTQEQKEKAVNTMLESYTQVVHNLKTLQAELES